MPSKRILEKKQEEVKSMVNKYRDAKTVVIVDYLGLNVAQDTELRSQFRANEIDYKVQKNRLFLIALNELGVEGAKDLLLGPTAVAMSDKEYVTPAKLCADAEKKYKAFEIKGGIMDGKIVSVEEIKALANLPSREQLIANVLGGLNAPISSFVSVLAANIRGLVRVLGAISENAAEK